jgi:hypothetical protein
MYARTPVLNLTHRFLASRLSAFVYASAKKIFACLAECISASGVPVWCATASSMQAVRSFS